MDGKALWHAAEGLSHLIKGLFGHGSGAALILFAVAIHFRPTPIQPIGFIGLVVFTGLKFRIQKRLKAGLHIFDFALGDQAITHQALCIKCEGGFLCFDLFVHQRIGKHRLIAFVVTKAAIADDIDNHVFFELLTEFCGDAGRMDHGLRIIAIDMENWCFNHQSNIRGIGGGAAEMRRGGEADLIVHHDVHSAAGLMPFQARQSKPFCHDTLTGKGRIPMQQDGKNAGALGIVILILFGARFAQYDRIDGLQMAWVGGERQMHGIAIKFAI